MMFHINVLVVLVFILTVFNALFFHIGNKLIQVNTRWSHLKLFSFFKVGNGILFGHWLCHSSLIGFVGSADNIGISWPITRVIGIRIIETIMSKGDLVIIIQ